MVLGILETRTALNGACVGLSLPQDTMQNTYLVLTEQVTL